MTEVRKPFVFDEHILPLDFDKFIKAERKHPLQSLAKFLLMGRETRKEKEDYERTERERYERHFGFLRYFFKEMEDQKYCNAEYIIRNPESELEIHLVRISGSGVETFDINGELSFEISKEKHQKTTHIPLIKNGEEFNLIVYEQPQIDFPQMGKIDVKYNFKTEFYLGPNCLWDEETRYKFTKDPSETHTIDLFNHLCPFTYYFFGEPGKLYYRFGDGLSKELNRAIMGAFTVGNFKRDRLNLQGKIYIAGTNQFFYQGNMDSSGFFPFFIRKEEGRDRTTEETPRIPKNLASPVMVSK